MGAYALAYIISQIGDTHTNSTMGCLHPDGMSLDDGGTYKLNAIQSHISERFIWYQDTLRNTIRKGDKVFGIHVADAMDNIDRAKTTQLISCNEADIVRAGYETLRPWVSLCRDGSFFLRGTPAHAGTSGYLEELLAAQFNALRWPKNAKTSSMPYLEAWFGEVLIHASHHATIGRLPWTRLNPLGTLSYRLLDAYRKRGAPIPRLSLRGHCHYAADTHDAYPIRMIVSPAFQMQTEYGNRIATGELPHIGGVIITIDGPEIDVKTLLYPPDPEDAWRAE